MRNLDSQRTFLNSFENIVNRRVNIPKDIRRFQQTLQYARSKVDYAIGEFVYMLLSDMNLRIGNVRNYNNKILISSPSFKIGTNVNVNIDGEQAKLKDKPDIMPKKEPDIKYNKEHKQDVKPNIELRKGDKQAVEMIKTEPNVNNITYEEER